MKPRLYGHRGAAIEQPENTMRSFEVAVECGADALEMDVHMSRDGHLVVSHDPNGKRMCGVDGAIKRCDLRDIQQWDAGWGFVDSAQERPFSGRGYQIPTLHEVLQAFPNHVLNIDLKQVHPCPVGPILKLVHEFRAQDRVILTSFSHQNLFHLRARGYQGLTGMGILDLALALYGPMSLLKRLPWRGQAAQIPARYRSVDLTSPDVIARLHAQDLRVDIWTVNNPKEARDLLAKGVDGIMTDDPRALAPLFAEHTKQETKKSTTAP